MEVILLSKGVVIILLVGGVINGLIISGMYLRDKFRDY
jgi:hypothetical protein